MGTQQLCLKWENHQTNMLSGFETLLSNEVLVDVTLACEGQSLKVHKLVLSACSPFFQKLLVQNPCQHPIVILNGVRYSDLKSIVDFMYHGEVNVSQDQLTALLQTAELLKVNGLAELNDKQSVNDNEVQQSSNTYSMSDNPHVPEISEDNDFAMQNKTSDNNNREAVLNSKILEDIKQEITVKLENTPIIGKSTSNIESEELPLPSITYPRVQNNTISPFHTLPSCTEAISSTKSLDYVLQHTSSIMEDQSFNECCITQSKVTDQISKADSIPEFSEHLPQSVSVSVPHLSSSSVTQIHPNRNQTDTFISLAESSNYYHNKQLLSLSHSQVRERSYRWKTSNRTGLEDSTSRLRCLQCKKVFSTTSNMKRHMEIHVLERKTYKCYICHKRFSWKTHLNSHLRRDHYKT